MDLLKNFRFRCHYIGEFATTAKEEISHKKNYNDFLNKISKANDEILTLKQETAKEKRRELITEYTRKADEYYKQYLLDKTYLSTTAFKRLLKIARELKYGIKENLDNKYVSKGLMNEEDSIRLWARSEHSHKKFLRKNTECFDDGLKSGEPDLLNIFEHGKVVDDIKTSYDKSTFDNKLSLSKLYYYQLQGYDDLLKYDWARVVFTLTNTPVDMVLAEFRNSMWKHLPQGVKIDDFIMFDEVKKIKTQFFRNHIYSDDGYIQEGEKWKYIESGYWENLVHSEQLDENYKFIPIPDEERLKVFQFKRNDDDINFINSKLINAKLELVKLLETRKGVEVIELSKEMCGNNDTAE